MSDTSEYRWLNDLSQKFVEKDYLLPGQTVDERITEICEHAEKILNKPGFAERFKENIKKGWYTLSTPVLANFGTDRGLPISCFGSYVEDTMESILDVQAEVGILTKYGGGTSVYLGKLRERGALIKDNGHSSGPVHFARLYDTVIDVTSQGNVRRGSCAIYLHLEHPDIEEFLDIRAEGHPIQNLSFGVCVSDEFLEKMIAGGKRERKIWAKVIDSRLNKGYPYIFFSGNANKAAPDVYKDLGMEITHTNLCTEIMECDTPEETFVCDLGSMVITYFDEWEHTDAVELNVYFLDAVMTEFIEKGKEIKHMEKAVRFAEKQRAIGLGWLGWHSYLQSKMIPFESMEAKLLNVRVAQNIQKAAVAASKKLAEEYGEPELLKGYGRRNTLWGAIAPTKSTTYIFGQMMENEVFGRMSENIEPYLSNYYMEDLAKRKDTFINPYLIKLLKEKRQYTNEVLNSILKNDGSVQHLDFLCQHEKDVFKTFMEISPKEVVIQAAQRQKFIDQGQPINLIFHENTPVKDINALYIEAWRLGIKSLYYQYSTNAAQNFAKNILSCASCDG